MRTVSNVKRQMRVEAGCELMCNPNQYKYK